MAQTKVIRAEKYVRSDFREVERRVIECPSCQGEVLCGEATNTCQCGAEFNMYGQRLAPREQWGEETGEHPVDIANFDCVNGEVEDY